MNQKISHINVRSLTYHPGMHLALILAIAFFILARTPAHMIAPPLMLEDGAILFTYYANRIAGDPLFIHYAGYISLGPNLLGLLASQAPTLWISHAFMLLAVLFNATAISVFFLPRFRKLLESDGLRLMVCLIFVLLPWGNSPLFRSVSYSFWSGLAATSLLILVPGRRLSATEYIYLAINICSAPISIVLLPILLWRTIREKSTSIATLFVLTSMYMLTVLFGPPANISTSMQLRSEPGRSEWMIALAQTIPAILDRVLFEPILTNWLRLRLIYANLHILVLTSGAIIATGLIYPALTKNIFRERISSRIFFVTGALYLIFIITTLSLYARFGPNDGFSYRDPFHHRYFWVQIYLTTILFAAIYAPFLSSTRALRWPIIASILLAIFVGGHLDSFEFETSMDKSEPTKVFLEQLSVCRSHPENCILPLQLDLGHEGFIVKIQRIPR